MHINTRVQMGWLLCDAPFQHSHAHTHTSRTCTHAHVQTHTHTRLALLALPQNTQIATINAINLCEDMKVEEELLRGIEGTCTATESEQATPSPEVRPPHTGAERELMRAIEQGTESEQLTPSPEARLPFTAGGSSTMTEVCVCVCVLG